MHHLVMQLLSRNQWWGRSVQRKQDLIRADPDLRPARKTVPPNGSPHWSTDSCAARTRTIMHAETRTDVNANACQPNANAVPPPHLRLNPRAHFNTLFIDTAVPLRGRVWDLSSWIHNTQIHVNCLLNRVIFACVFQGKQSSVRRS